MWCDQTAARITGQPAKTTASVTVPWGAGSWSEAVCPAARKSNPGSQVKAKNRLSRSSYLEKLVCSVTHISRYHCIDLLQLPCSHQGSSYVLACVNHFCRFTVLDPLPNKSATTVAHALVSHLICPYMTPRVLLSDNGTEFKNQILQNICNQFSIKQIFITAYHPASNGFVERTNRKSLKFFATLQESSMNHGKIVSPMLLPLLMVPLTLSQTKLHITLYIVLTNVFNMTCWCTPLSPCTP